MVDILKHVSEMIAEYNLEVVVQAGFILMALIIFGDMMLSRRRERQRYEKLEDRIVDKVFRGNGGGPNGEPDPSLQLIKQDIEEIKNRQKEMHENITANIQGIEVLNQKLDDRPCIQSNCPEGFKLTEML